MASKLRNKKQQAKVLNLLGANFQLKSNYPQAIEYYQRSLKIGEELNDPDLMLVANGNIGALYIILGEHKKAEDYQLNSLAIAEKNNKKAHMASIYNNLALIANVKKEYKKAVEFGNKSIKLNKELEDLNGCCSAYGNIGNAYLGLKNYDKALECFLQSNKIAVEMSNNYEETNSLIDIGNIYLTKKDYKKAVEYFKIAEKIAEKNENEQGRRGAFQGLYKAYRSLGDKDQALKYNEYFYELSNHINEEEKAEEVNKKVIEFAFNKKTVADSIRNAEANKYKDVILRANKAQIQKDKALKIALSVGLILVLAFGAVIFNRFRITSKQKKIIEAKNKQTEEQKLIIEEKQKEILDSINYAKRIQDSLLDNFDAVTKFFSDSFLLNKPKDIVSGDFYWISKKTVSEQTIGNTSILKELFFIAVCDSTGHGVPGGFMSLLNIAYLSEATNEKDIYQPNKIFDYVRTRLINTISKNDQKDGFDGVLMSFEKTFHFENKQLIKTDLNFTYAAAHNAPHIVRNNNLIELQTDKMPVGYGEINRPFALFSYDLNPGDVIYVYTDGYADQFGGPKGKKFKYRQLNDLLVSINNKPLYEQANVLNVKFEEWKGNIEQVDDVCLIGLKI